jgi:hypothetical protein
LVPSGVRHRQHAKKADPFALLTSFSSSSLPTFKPTLSSMRALAAGLAALPLLTIPDSNITVNIKVINSFDTRNPQTRQSVIYPSSSSFYFPTVNTGATVDIDIYAFYIEHPSKDGQLDRLMFDVGLRKDLQNLAPSKRDVFKGNIPTDVPEQLVAGGIDLASIKSVIWRLVAVVFEP